MAHHGLNSGGTWDAAVAEATYETEHHDESPLWNTHSQVMTWWTATQIDDERAYMIAYDEKVWARDRDFGPAYLGFRCVKGP